MNDLTVNAGIIALSGMVATILTALINKAWWTKARKQWVSVAVSLVLGVVALVLDGIFTAPPTGGPEIFAWVAGTVAAVAAASQIIYAQFSEKLKDLEWNTTSADSWPIEEEDNGAA